MISGLPMIAVAVPIGAAMAGAWWVQRRTRNASWVDAIWTAATGIGGGLGAALAIAGGAPRGRAALIGALALLWSARLGWHIARRAAQGHEDPRYTALRTLWGAGYEPRMFAFLQLQALIAWLLALSIFVAAANPVHGARLLDGAGLAVLAIAIAGEALADRQLRRFRADPANRGRICDSGLWGWSRHPNYFFEWLVWIGFLLFAVDVRGGYRAGWIALVAPIIMYWLLVYVSGVVPVERAMEQSRGDQFRAYRDRVSRFFPWPPRRPAAGAPI